MRGRNRFDCNIPQLADGYYRHTAALTEGMDQSRTTAGTYSDYYVNIDFSRPVFLHRVLWDIYAAETYQFLLDGVYVCSVVSAGTEADAVFVVNKLIYGGTVKFQFTPGSPVNLYDNGSNYYTGTYIYIPRQGYYGGDSFSYGGAIKLVYSPIVLEPR